VNPVTITAVVSALAQVPSMDIFSIPSIFNKEGFFATSPVMAAAREV
jgi:hypothetical protein